MSDLQVICKKLDKNTDALMNTITEILQTQAELDASMKQGFFFMSKARYSLGVKRVSALQYNLDDLTDASAKVKISETCEPNVKDGLSPTFSLSSSESNISPDHTQNLRQRKTNIEDISSNIKNLDIRKSEDDGKGDKNEGHPEKDVDKKKSNPLNWFGVLVPQSLRQCQSCFVKATEHSCLLASLKANLLHLRKVQQDLMKKKKALLPEKETVESDEGRSTEEISGSESQ